MFVFGVGLSISVFLCWLDPRWARLFVSFAGPFGTRVSSALLVDTRYLCLTCVLSQRLPKCFGIFFMHYTPTTFAVVTTQRCTGSTSLAAMATWPHTCCWQAHRCAMIGESVSGSSSTPWTGASKSWGQIHSVVQITMAAVAEPVVVHEEVHGGLVNVKRVWTFVQCLHFGSRTLPTFFEHVNHDTLRQWFTMKTPETAVILALADIESYVCSKVCCGAGVMAELMNARVETLGVAHHCSTLRVPPVHARAWVCTPKNPRASPGRSGPMQRNGHSANWASSRSNGRWRMQASQTAAGSTKTRRADKYCHCSGAAASPKARRTTSWTCAATSPSSSPPGISCLTCTPNDLVFFAMIRAGVLSAVLPASPATTLPRPRPPPRTIP